MSQPNKIPRAFAASGDKNSIPDSTGSIGFASWQEGFPAITSEPFSNGGVAPKRADFNGIFNALSAATVWNQQGGVYAYDNTTDYEVGNLVEDSGDIYQCMVANGPNSSIQSPSDQTVWSKLMNVTDVNSVLSSYLPLAGGTMTGSIVSTTLYNLRNADNTTQMTILGGSDGGATSGAKLILSGADHANAGDFNLQAGNANGYKQLIGKPDGTLTWDGKDVCVVDSVDNSTDGYIRFTNGLQLVWGRKNIPSGSESTGVAVTYEKPFSSAPCIFANVSFNSAYGYGYAVQPTSRTATGCQMFIGSSSGGTSQNFTNGYFYFLAIGPWA